MSMCSLSLTLSRIETARISSPIAVFKPDHRDLFRVVFASTVQSQREIEKGTNLLGVFDKTDNRKAMRQLLINAPAIST